ncbi:sulfite exporter TauE/SafE family protein [Aquirhabdus sp.]|uniref:sulfite exporter TauE/SafE family protein n=1 Tax=Aquirhabdus sp. TaxID=2824160 RepID=UPI00396C91C2
MQPPDLIFLGFFAFCAGLIDSVVGGGGLIQIPALFNALPNALPATIFGTNKIAAISGTLSAAWSYVRRVKLPWALIIPAMLAAFVMSFTGAAIVSLIPKSIMQPVVFVLLIIMAIYTFHKKEFGLLHTHLVVGRREKLLGILTGGAIGLYDGVFGPGTGSFLIFLFIRLFSFDFLHASAASKLVNVATNAAALLYFVPTGHVLWQIALIMAACNIIGSLAGTRLALKHGAGFVRVLFLVLLIGLIGKMGWGMLK